MDPSTCRADGSIERRSVEGFSFPLGVYPIEPMTPAPGYTLDFESADGDDYEWEEWPDRYVFDIVVSAERLKPLVWGLLSLFPGRVYPILDVLGRDAYREIDPYISYDLCGTDRLLEAFRRFEAFLLEDGLVGVGAMSDQPFYYVFVDEHKIVTVRAEPKAKERVEKLLAAFGLSEMSDPAGADAVAHEHRSVLEAPEDQAFLLTGDEIVERLRDDWRLVLNVDPDQNLDPQGDDLGTTPWRCLVRVEDDEAETDRYADVFLTANSLRQAERLALDTVSEDAKQGKIASVIVSDRVVADEFFRDLGVEASGERRRELSRPKIWDRRWLDREPGGPSTPNE
ncbi:MAG: hypothetical protein AAF108_04880 [Planctomycetota bacterium]